MKIFDDRIKELGYTREDISILTGLSFTQVSRIAKGNVRHPKPKTINLLSEALEMDEDEMRGLLEDTYVNTHTEPRSLYLDGTFIHVKLREKGIKHSDFAKTIGMAPSTFSHYVTGKNRAPIEDIYKISNTLGCNKSDIIQKRHKKRKSEEKETVIDDQKLSSGIDKFVEECCILDEGSCTFTSALYKAYDRFCKEHPEYKAKSMIPFSSYLESNYNLQPYNDGNARGKIGIHLRDQFVTESSDSVTANEKDIVTQQTHFLPAVITSCTRCMFENVVNIKINENFSYPADTIQKWARRSICHLTDKDSVDYDPDMVAMISDMLFNYFINRKKPLRTDARYFVREKKGKLHLKRDRGETDSLHEYTISRSDESGNHVTRVTMSESERDKIETIFRDLNIDYTIGTL